MALLPTETWHAVFSALPPASLLAASLVSRHWHAIAAPILYASLSITDALAPAPARTDALLAALLARPRLAAHTKHLHLRWHAPAAPKSPSPDPAPAESTLHTLARVLPTLTELLSLDLLLGPAGACVPPSALLSPCRFPALTSLSLAGLAPSLATSLPPFLAAHPTLTHLRLSDTPSPLPLPPSALPHLHAFAGSPATAASLLPSRPVAHLTLLGAHPERILPADLARMGTRVRVLDLALISVTPPLLRAVSAHFPSLEVLRVRLALRHTLHFALSGIVSPFLLSPHCAQTLIPDQALLAALTPVLSSFALLTELDLSPTDVPGRAQPAEEHSLCATYARACPSLIRVVFPSGAEWWRGGVDGLWVGRCL
ncbi:hypothetical protein OE88DRAFT_1735008 [Heliocybe sulcata]|uniref:F-box domain-containing protein n=1 Tax=Heliocybe sulcata TaxID=5364 RepID=A0A5C3N2Z6_9AGAM|nr:hypothetical protein OE88DRAFT_1735008 [Heliocybe sulcata]